VRVFHRLSLGNKLRVSFLLLSLASAVVGAFGLWVTGSLTEEVRELSWNRLPAQQALGRAHEGVTRMRVYTRDGLVAALQKDAGALVAAWRGRETARAQSMQGLAKFGESTMTKEEETLWRPVEPAFQEYLQGTSEVWQVLRAHDPERASLMLDGLAQRTERDLVAPLEQLADLESKIADQRMVEADETAVRARRALWTVLGLTFAAAAAMAIFLPRSVARPIRSLSAVALRIADGDLTAEVLFETRDEVGRLAESFQRMVARLRQIVSTLKAASRELALAAEELTENTRAQNLMLGRQAAGVAETSTATRELEQTSSLAANRAAAVLEVARRGAEMSTSGQEAAERSQQGLRRMEAAVAGLLGQSSLLIQKARQVGEVVETVSDLATQSHVLSLNASIEAASAGEAGRGFAAVAQEVRSLAQQSGAGAQRIARAVRDIQAAVEASRAATEAGTQGMAASLDEMRSSGESLREIGGVVRETSQAATQIAAAVQQQSAGIGQIATAMRELDAGMEETVGRVRSLEHSAAQVAETAAGIAGIAGQFQL
jgi:methyl-accepting chemotaxis protein